MLRRRHRSTWSHTTEGILGIQEIREDDLWRHNPTNQHDWRSTSTTTTVQTKSIKIYEINVVQYFLLWCGEGEVVEAENGSTQVKHEYLRVVVQMLLCSSPPPSFSYVMMNYWTGVWSVLHVWKVSSYMNPAAQFHLLDRKYEADQNHRVQIC